eukprot:1203988-Rhodomonas_salina.4
MRLGRDPHGEVLAAALRALVDVHNEDRSRDDEDEQVRDVEGGCEMRHPCPGVEDPPFHHGSVVVPLAQLGPHDQDVDREDRREQHDGSGVVRTRGWRAHVVALRPEELPQNTSAHIHSAPLSPNPCPHPFPTPNSSTRPPALANSFFPRGHGPPPVHPTTLTPTA